MTYYNNELAKNPKTNYKKVTFYVTQNGEHKCRNGILKEATLLKLKAVSATLYCRGSELVRLGNLWKA